MGEWHGVEELRSEEVCKSILLGVWHVAVVPLFQGSIRHPIRKDSASGFGYGHPLVRQEPEDCRALCAPFVLPPSFSCPLPSACKRQYVHSLKEGITDYP